MSLHSTSLTVAAAVIAAVIAAAVICCRIIVCVVGDVWLACFLVRVTLNRQKFTFQINMNEFTLFVHFCVASLVCYFQGIVNCVIVENEVT